ncbi:unnamed protein product [Moneuplotes crassus]|uniref:Uncharacterized protein n=1 Tax=Euplotes crassus TaxID=5936 RepID=A0AAD1UIG4_EUPCR|nr:unnamed protein product [Moneuplotes crassus]
MDEECKGTTINLETIMKRIHGDDSSPSHDSFDSGSDSGLVKPSSLAERFKTNPRFSAKANSEKITQFPKRLNYSIIQKMRDKGMLKPKKASSPVINKGILKNLSTKSLTKSKKLLFTTSPKKKVLLSSRAPSKKSRTSLSEKDSSVKSPLPPKNKNSLKHIYPAFIDAIQKREDEEEEEQYPFSKREAIKLAPLIGLNALTPRDKLTKDYKKYAWFLKIVLGSKLPPGYTRETAPGKEVIYFNEITGKVSKEHPRAGFFKKTFTKIVKAELESKKNNVMDKIVIDEATKHSIAQRSEKNKEKVVRNTKKGKRSIILGSSLSKSLADKLTNKIESQEPTSREINKSTERYNMLTKFIQNKSQRVNPKIERKHEKNQTLKYYQFLKRTFGDSINAIFDNDSVKAEILSFFPTLTSEILQDIEEKYHSDQNLQENKRYKATFRIKPATQTSFKKHQIRSQKCKIKRAAAVRANSRLFLEKAKYLDIKKIPSDEELIIISQQLSINIPKDDPNLLLAIFNAYMDFREKHKVPWRYRNYQDKKYWVYKNDIRETYPYLEEMKKIVSAIFGIKPESKPSKITRRTSSKSLGIMTDKSLINTQSYTHAMTQRENLTLSPEKICESNKILSKISTSENIKDLVSIINKEREKVSEVFISNSIAKRSGKGFIASASLPNLHKECTYNLEDFKKTIGANITDKEAMDLLFYCPFKFPDTRDIKKRNSVDRKCMKLSSFSKRKIKTKYSICNAKQDSIPVPIKKEIKRLQPIKNTDLLLDIISLSAESIQSQDTVSDATDGVFMKISEDHAKGLENTKSDTSTEKKNDQRDSTQRDFDNPEIVILPSKTLPENINEKDQIIKIQPGQEVSIGRETGGDKIKIQDLSQRTRNPPKDYVFAENADTSSKLNVPSKKRRSSIFCNNNSSPGIKATTKRLSDEELPQFKNLSSEGAITSEAAQSTFRMNPMGIAGIDRFRLNSKEMGNNSSKSLYPLTQRRKININNNLDMKDPYIQKRTKLTLRQAKLMASLNKNKINRGKFNYMLNHITSTKARRVIQKLLGPTKIIMNDFKNESSLVEEESDLINLPKEVEDIISEYNSIRLSLLRTQFKESENTLGSSYKFDEDQIEKPFQSISSTGVIPNTSRKTYGQEIAKNTFLSKFF